MSWGKIFNIQRYSIHDGPGIRTTVFLKGCPLSCWWCHNPESLEIKTEIAFWENKCLGCGDCVKICPQQAITLSRQGLKRNEAQCVFCGMCAQSCPAGALEAIGKEMTVAEVLREIEKDRVFYEESGGGVTFSGGEALQQIEFLEKILTACRERGIHTVLDTCGYAPWEAIAAIADKVDLFLYDIKIMFEVEHEKYTGVPNAVILDNLQKLAAAGYKIWIRMPVIPEINDTLENLEKMGEFLSTIHLKDVYLLPYNNMVVDKYARLKKTYQLAALASVTDEQMAKTAQKLQEYGLNIKLGGA